MERSPSGWHSRPLAGTVARTATGTGGVTSPKRAKASGRLATALSIAAVIGLALPTSLSGAASASPNPTLKQLLAAAARLSRQIDAMSQQYDAMRIQYTQAKAQAKIARLTAARDKRMLKAAQVAVAQIAAAGYMTGGVDPAISLLQSKNPQSILNRASILGQLQRENGVKIHLVTSARTAAERARVLALQQEHKAANLSKAMQRKVAKIQANESKLNSAVFAKALAIYRRTGNYPPIHIIGDSIGVQALRIAMTRIGDAYVWGGAGPNVFDCSGLVVWAYAQLGISLPHFTGDLWNSGVHVSRSQLKPGDLLFFFPGISHVGIFVGHRFMLDAPTFGIPVGIHAIPWGAYDGGVRIA